MADDTQIVLEQELLRMQMEESREALAQKIERLEEKVTETVESATASVAEILVIAIFFLPGASCAGSAGAKTNATMETSREKRPSFMAGIV